MVENLSGNITKPNEINLSWENSGAFLGSDIYNHKVSYRIVNDYGEDTVSYGSWVDIDTNFNSNTNSNNSNINYSNNNTMLLKATECI